MNQIYGAELDRQLARLVAHPEDHQRPLYSFLPPKEDKSPLRVNVWKLSRLHRGLVMDGFVKQTNDLANQYGAPNSIKALGAVSKEMNELTQIIGERTNLPTYSFYSDGDRALLKDAGGRIFVPKRMEIILVDSFLSTGPLFHRIVNGLKHAGATPLYATGFLGFDFPDVEELLQEEDMGFHPLLRISTLKAAGLSGNPEDLDRFDDWYNRRYTGTADISSPQSSVTLSL